MKHPELLNQRTKNTKCHRAIFKESERTASARVKRHLFTEAIPLFAIQVVIQENTRKDEPEEQSRVKHAESACLS